MSESTTIELGGEVSTLRFITPQGEWAEIMQPVYDSLTVAEDTAV
jgi:hypothetical protein